MNIDFNPLFLQKKGIFMVNKKNPFAFKVKQETKKKSVANGSVNPSRIKRIIS